jgi:hypothetical protein
MIEGSADTDPYLVLMDPDTRGPKTYGSYGSGSGSGSATLLRRIVFYDHEYGMALSRREFNYKRTACSKGK